MPGVQGGTTVTHHPCCMQISAFLLALLFFLSHSGFETAYARHTWHRGIPSAGQVSHDKSKRLSNFTKFSSRKLFGLDRIGGGGVCSKADITILQGKTSPLPNGIPTYSVQIFNLCGGGCPISNIHVACGWFASAKLVNPKLFRRLKFNDCLVNDGKPINGDDSISFEYANSSEYPLAVSSVTIAENCP